MVLVKLLHATLRSGHRKCLEPAQRRWAFCRCVRVSLVDTGNVDVIVMQVDLMLRV